MKKRYLFLFLVSGLVIMNACLKEKSQESGGPSQGSLQDDGTGDCFPKTVGGVYVVGTGLVNTTHYIDVQVDVVQAGTYTIYTDTVNGMYFRASGVFSATGLNTVRLPGFGTPGAVGITNFIITYGTSVCTVAINVASSLAVFTLDGAPGTCSNATPAGTYTAGTPLTASNTVSLQVTVTTAGAYNISTTASNGMTFSGTGTLLVGAQTIVLTGAGTPTTPGTTNIPVTVGSSSCSFSITVGGTATPATYTINCAAAVINGTYTQNTALTASNTIVVTADVTAPGTYTITGTINGMTFSATGTFAAAGAGQSVTLTGTGTPSTSGANVVPLTGGTANCNVTVTVAPAGGGTAVFVVNCAGATINGTYTQNTALTAANTVVVPVNVTTIGTYTITATAGGMTFSATGSFAATGTVNVTLNGTGTPNASGPVTFNVTAGTTPCNFIVNVNPAGGGAAVFTINCATPATVTGTYVQNTALGAIHSVVISVNVTTIGTYSITTTAVNGMTFTSSGGASFTATGIQSVTLFGSGTPTAAGTFFIPIPSGACNFLVIVSPAATATDYFPRVANNNWSYEFDNDATDSFYRKVIVPTFTALGNTYNIFMFDDGSGFDSSGYYRRSGGDYFEYLDVGSFIGFDNPLRAEYIMLKDNVAQGTNWKSAGYTGTVTPPPPDPPQTLTIRFSYTVVQKDVPITITASGTGSITYQNVIVVEEKYDALIGGVWTDITPLIDFYGKSYYARGVGLIKYEFLDASNVVQISQELRRWVVY